MPVYCGGQGIPPGPKELTACLHLLPPSPPMTDQRLIEMAIAASGLSSRRFAELLMGRDERTIRRWIVGKVEIPPLARAFLERWLALNPRQQAAILSALAG
jgi:hypothetical protein